MSFLIPAGILAGGVISGLFKNEAEQDKASEANRLYNAWLTNRDAAAHGILDDVSAHGYDPFGPQVTTGSSSGTSSSSMNSNTHSTLTPTITPQFQPLVNLQNALLTRRLQSPSSLPAGYAQRAVAGINAAAKPGQQAIRNLAARRGLSAEQLSIGSPVEQQRRGQIADLIAGLPLQERQMQNEDLQMAQSLAQAFGRGEEGFSNTRGSQTTNSSSNSMATAPPNISSLASLLLPPGPNAGNNTGISVVGGGVGDLSSALLALYGMGAFGGGAAKPNAAAMNLYNNDPGFWHP